MRELIITRSNELVDPFVHVWGWEVPLYLFLGGWVAGMMIITGYFLWRGRHREPTCVCSMLPWLAVALLSLGMLALFLDLEHKLYVWRLYTTVKLASPMSWGAWILVLVYPALVGAGIAGASQVLRDLVPAIDRAREWLVASMGRVRAIALLNILLGTALGIYTGILLSALGARPLWSSAMLGPVFLLSGMSAAAAFTHLVARHASEREFLARADNVLLAVELLAIGLFLIGLLTASQAQARAAQLLLGGAFTAPFWVFVVALGIVVPLGVQLLAVTHRVFHTAVAPLLVIAGGLALRFVIVYAGQVSHWIG